MTKDDIDRWFEKIKERQKNVLDISVIYIDSMYDSVLEFIILSFFYGEIDILFERGQDPLLTSIER